MGDKPFIKFYPSDFLAGTSGLSPAERGVYITLLCLIYEADGAIARDDARLARRCGVPKASFSRTVDALIDQGKLTDQDGLLSNKRAEKTIVDRQTRTQNATHAAHKKWSAHRLKIVKNQRQNDAGAMPEQCAGDASQRPEPDIKKEPKGSLKKPRLPELDLPEEWIPNHKNIEDAEAKGLSAQEIQNEADSFRDYHHAKQSRFRNWDAAWRTWINNSIKFSGNRRVAGHQRSGGYEQGGSIASIVARRRAEGKV